MNDEGARSAIRTTWESAAPGWARWEHEFSKDFGEVTDRLLDFAGVGPGMSVLDLACGAGSQTLRAAERVGAGGRVTACDISAEMLKHLQANAERAGVENIDTLRCAAEDLQTELAFDAAFSRFGLMLFAAPGQAVSALARILKPGRRFAALVLTTPERNAWQAQPMAIALEHSGKPPPAPGQPGLFALGGDGVLERLLRQSGLVDIEMANVRAPLRFASADEAVRFMQEAAGAFRAVLADLSEDRRAAAWADIRDSLTQYEGAAGFAAELDLLIGSGAAPASA